MVTRKKDIASNPIIFFDGVCNLCTGSVKWIIKNDPKGVFRFASLQDSKTLERFGLKPFEDLDPDSIWLLESGELYNHSTAALRIAKKLRFPISALYIFMLIPPFIRDSIYKWIARNRYHWFGKSDVCMMPTPEIKDRFL
jgi:predicted DCC family thiol-disulfide oxidoreductase YuxK